MTEQTEKLRSGEVVRIFPNARNIMVMDVETRHFFPCYRFEGQTKAFDLGDKVQFTTDPTDTVIVTMKKASVPINTLTSGGSQRPNGGAAPVYAAPVL